MYRTLSGLGIILLLLKMILILLYRTEIKITNFIYFISLVYYYILFYIMFHFHFKKIQFVNMCNAVVCITLVAEYVFLE